MGKGGPSLQGPRPRLSMSIFLKGTRLLTCDDAALLSGGVGSQEGPTLELGPTWAWIWSPL